MSKLDVAHHKYYSEHWRHIWFAIINIADNRAKEANTIKSFLNFLIDYENYSYSKLFFLYNILENSEQIIRGNLRNHDAVIRSFLGRIKDRYLDLLKRPFSNYFYELGQSLKSDYFFVHLIVVQYSKHFPTEYKDLWFDKIIDNEDNIFGLLKLVLINDSETKTPFGLIGKNIDVLLPNELLSIFLNKLKLIDQTSYLDREDRLNLEYFLENHKKNNLQV